MIQFEFPNYIVNGSSTLWVTEGLINCLLAMTTSLRWQSAHLHFPAVPANSPYFSKAEQRYDHVEDSGSVISI